MSWIAGIRNVCSNISVDHEFQLLREGDDDAWVLCSEPVGQEPDSFVVVHGANRDRM